MTVQRHGSTDLGPPCMNHNIMFKKKYIQYVTYKKIATFFFLCSQKMLILSESLSSQRKHSSQECRTQNWAFFSTQYKVSYASGCCWVILYISVGARILRVCREFYNICYGGVAKVFTLIRLLWVIWPYEVLIDN